MHSNLWKLQCQFGKVQHKLKDNIDAGLFPQVSLGVRLGSLGVRLGSLGSEAR